MQKIKDIFNGFLTVIRPTRKKLIVLAILLSSIALVIAGAIAYRYYHNNKIALTIFGTTKYKVKDIATISRELKAAGLDDKLASTFIENKEKLHYLTDNVPELQPSDKELDEARKILYPSKNNLSSVEEDDMYRNIVFGKYKALKYGSYLGTVFIFPYDSKDDTAISSEANAKSKAALALNNLKSNKQSSAEVLDAIFNDSAFNPSNSIPNPSGDFLSTDLSEKTFAFEDINDGIFNHKDAGYSNIEKAIKPNTDVQAAGAYYFYYIEPTGYQKRDSNIDAQVLVVVDLVKDIKAK